MKTLKVPLKLAGSVQEFVRKNNLLEKGYEYTKDRNNIYMAVKDEKSIIKKFPTVKTCSKVLKKRNKLPTTLKDALKDKLPKKLLDSLKTAFDTVGDIAIIEVDDELKKHESLIAKTLLRLNKQIKVVAKKIGTHGGTFRTQKLKVIAGEKRKETIHTENSIKLKLDVEKVYFSPRLSTERKRIMKQVKKDEDILVMFSGCAPYPCVLAKNTKAKHITGIEINPIGHKYGLENIKLNKLNNVTLHCGDVNDWMPIKKLGLKSRWIKKEMDCMIKQKPEIIEIHLNDGDIEKHRKKIEKCIERLKDFDVYIHQPFKTYKGHIIELDLQTESAMEAIEECYAILEGWCDKYPHVKGWICHPEEFHHSVTQYDFKNSLKHAKRLKLKYAIFENYIVTPYSDLKNTVKIAKASGSNRICIDLLHLYLHYKNTKKMIEVIKSVPKSIETYFHVSDCIKGHDSLAVGKGKINFKKLEPYITKGIHEVVAKDYHNPKEPIGSYKLPLFNKRFDRILMPLPKSAEDFLDTALSNAGKGTIIHFYDFLHENDFKKAEEKIKKACKRNKLKHKILGTHKCGQHAPRVYRICVDFKIV